MRVVAGSVSVLLGLGFGLPCLLGIRHFARTGEVWMFMGFPTYGNGPSPWRCCPLSRLLDRLCSAARTPLSITRTVLLLLL
jgi:hypothetical protein